MRGFAPACAYSCGFCGYYRHSGVISMQKELPRRDDLRLEPEKRLCAKFDSASIAKFRVASPAEMGMRVLDNCAEEHIM